VKSVGEARQPEIGWMILADKAEALNGKIYMLGGGFDRLVVRDIRNQPQVGIAMEVLVPREMAGQPIPLVLSREYPDGRAALPSIAAGNMTMPIMPTQLADGIEMLRGLIVITVSFDLPSAGTYIIGATLGEGLKKMVRLDIVVDPGVQEGRQTSD
jgi:hypothetical protein